MCWFFKEIKLNYIKDMIKVVYFNDKICNESFLDFKIGKFWLYLL